MKVVVIGGTGTIGSEVVKKLEPDHEVIAVGHSSGGHQVDLGSKGSIKALLDEMRPFDAVVSAAGEAKFGSLDELGDDDFMLGLNNKLMGQANLVRVGRQLINDGGSFTLTSGVLAQEPMQGSASISMVNAGLEGFVRAAALELERQVRVNVVSPIWVTETLEELGMDTSQGMPAARVAKAYRASLEGDGTGEVLDVREFV